MWLAGRADWIALAAGVVNIGRLPEGIPLATFLAALVYSGAGESEFGPEPVCKRKRIWNG